MMIIFTLIALLLFQMKTADHRVVGPPCPTIVAPKIMLICACPLCSATLYEKTHYWYIKLALILWKGVFLL